MNNPSITAYRQICNILGVASADNVEVFPDVPGTTLVIVPDQTFDYKQLIKLAQAFGEDQPYQTYIYNDLYKQYSAEELSGKPSDKDYRYLYIPEKYNVAQTNVMGQLNNLGSNHVPTVLEAIVYWFVLCEAGKTLNFDSTYIRHFDLEPKRLDGWLSVPDSYVVGGGQPYLGYSRAQLGYDARVSVGLNLNLASSLESSSLNDLQENTKAMQDLTEVIKKVFHI